MEKSGLTRLLKNDIISLMKRYLYKSPIFQLASILLRKDLRSNLIKGDWGYIYFTHLSKFNPDQNSKEVVIELIGPDVSALTHTGLCAKSCQCSDALTLSAINQIS
jgi:hypothetical protein